MLLFVQAMHLFLISSAETVSHTMLLVQTVSSGPLRMLAEVAGQHRTLTPGLSQGASSGALSANRPATRSTVQGEPCPRLSQPTAGWVLAVVQGTTPLLCSFLCVLFAMPMSCMKHCKTSSVEASSRSSCNSSSSSFLGQQSRSFMSMSRLACRCMSLCMGMQNLLVEVHDLMTMLEPGMGAGLQQLPSQPALKKVTDTAEVLITGKSCFAATSLSRHGPS